MEKYAQLNSVNTVALLYYHTIKGTVQVIASMLIFDD